MPLDPFTQNRSLSSEQGYELARVGNKMGLPVELQRWIWADVTENYYSRGSVIDRAATVLQVALRRVLAIMKLDRNFSWPWHQGPDLSHLYPRAETRFLSYQKRMGRFRRIQRGSSKALAEQYGQR